VVATLGGFGGFGGGGGHQDSGGRAGGFVGGSGLGYGGGGASARARDFRSARRCTDVRGRLDR